MSAFSIDRIGFIFTDALAEVVSITSGFLLDISSLEDDSDFNEMVGFMSLNGKNQGIVFISAEEATMRVICSFMTGISKDEVTRNDIEDALCELVNMTAGNAKLRFNEAEQIYTLSPPFFIRGKDMSITTKKRVSIISRVLKNEEISIKLKVVFY
ncbi:MAG: chemotaxis protein CheX [Spirochaetaceae bacterium]|nr:chemotaxis protein CheX [Spirochaetaceae bacterium]